MERLDTRYCEEIMTTVYKPIEFVIDGLIAQGLYILAGAPKVGISWLSLDICLSIAKGEKVLDHETKCGTALYTSQFYSQMYTSDQKAISNIISNITGIHCTYEQLALFNDFTKQMRTFCNSGEYTIPVLRLTFFEKKVLTISGSCCKIYSEKLYSETGLTKMAAAGKA